MRGRVSYPVNEINLKITKKYIFRTLFPHVFFVSMSNPLLINIKLILRSKYLIDKVNTNTHNFNCFVDIK